jgi:hypothetical protein
LGAAQHSQAPAEPLAADVQAALQRLISSDVVVGSGTVIDASGTSTPSYPIVIYQADSERASSTENPTTIAADRLAVVIEVYQERDPERLREGYLRTTEVKQSPVPTGETRTNITFGAVFALESSVTLDALADPLYQLDLVIVPSHYPGRRGYEQVLRL